MIRNKKGMTLIEILVVLVISSLVMVIAASLILNGLGYFNKTASGDVDKRVTDTISSYVREELIYASNVRISTTKPEDNENEWHSLAINKNGYLEKDDEQLYQEDYYNHKILKLEANTYGDTYRLDLKFSLMEGKKAKYTTSTTLELINIKTKILDVGDGEEKALAEMVDISYETGNKIYYQTGNLGISDVEDVPPTEIQGGTVGDESKCKSDDNTKEWGSGTGSVKYKKDTFVEYNGKLYRAIMDVKDNGSNPADNQKGYWKLIDSVFHETSSYLKGDVIEYPKGSDEYYICIKNIYRHNMTPGTAQGDKYWESIEKENINKDKYNSCETKTSYVEGTVGAEETCISENNLMEWEAFEDTGKHISYPTGTYIEYPTGSGSYYKAVRNGANNVHSPFRGEENEQNSFLWKKIDTNWDKYSSYETGDIVYDGSEYADTENGRGKGYYRYIGYFTNMTSTPPSDKSNYAYWKPIKEEDVLENDACHTTYP